MPQSDSPKRSNKGLVIGLISVIVVLVIVIIVMLARPAASSLVPDELGIADTASVTTEQELEQDPPVQYENTIIKKEFVYKANCERALYGTASYNIQWPVSAGNYNIEPLQKELAKICFKKNSTDIHNLVSTAAKRFALEDYSGPWLRVNTSGESEDVDGELNDDYPMFPPSYEANVKLGECNEGNGLVRYDVILSTDIGSGVGAGCASVLYFVYYDTKQERIVKFNDVFVNGAKNQLKSKLKSNPICPTYVSKSDLWLNELTEVPTSFYVKESIVYFVFDKYAIAPGCCGNVELGLKINDIQDLMTPYALEIFGFNE